MTTATPRRPRERGGARDSAPVDYAPIRPVFQSVRAGLALILLAVTAAGAATGVPGSGFEMGLVAVILVDALVRIRLEGSVLPSLVIDLVAGGLAVGAGNDLAAPIIAYAAYLLTAGVMLLPARQVVLLLAAAPPVILVRELWLAPPPGPAHDAWIAWAEMAVYFLATTLILLVSVGMIHRARAQQVAALQAERRTSEIKNEFVSMVSHELRTPLTNIAGFAMTVLETWRDLDPAEIDEFLEIICREADHLRNIVDDVLAIPRLEAGRLLLDPTDFPLRPVAYRIAELSFPPGGEREASVAVPGTVYVRADPNRVEQVLRNLLENARKYGGSQVAIEAHRSGNHWTIVVLDNGPGVPEADRERIFEGFEQLVQGDSRESNGLGLGLFITRRLVEAMGGRVWYEPGFPVGSRFCFTLPAATGAAETQGAGTQAESPAARS